MKGWRQIFLILVLVAGVTSGAAAREGSAVPATQVVTAEMLRGALESFVDSRRPFLPRADIRFRLLELPEPFTLPAGKLEIEVIPADPQLLASRRFTLLMRVDGRVERNLAVRAELEAIAEVAVAAGELRRGTLLTPRDINLAPLDLARLRHPCFDPEELVGRTLRRSVRTGEPLGHADIEIPPLVKRGEAVTMTARKGGILVTARGTAQQDGIEGAQIKVRNSSSQKEILCRVRAPGQVEVEF